jgi:16S rRNA (uracil1498-N3)-methyltransferase
MIRLYVAAALTAGGTVAASEGQAHYLTSVMRRAEGDAVGVFNGRDGEWRARLAVPGRRRVELVLEAELRPQAPEPDLWLAFAPLRRDATELVAQKATELGVSALVPVLTERTNAARLNTDRLRAIAVEAAEQCERLSVPAIREAVALPALLAAWPAGRRLAVAVERGGPAAIPHGAGALLVGPEGGFSPREVDALRGASFMAPISLGPRVLRAETAAIAGLALLQAQGWSTN